MSFITQRINEGVVIAEAGLAPVSQAAATVTSAGVDMSKFARVRYVLYVGAFGASATVDAKVRQSAASNLSSPIDVTGAAITQMLAAGGNNKIVTIEVTAAMLTAGYRYAFLSVTVGTAATLICAICEAVPAYASPGSQYNDAAVVQTINVPS